MNLCDECQTAAHCLRNGCIPIQQPTEAQKEARVAATLRRVEAMNLNHAMTACDPGWFERVGRFIPFRKPAPLKFPEIDPNLLPTKETTA